jgi:hypothetical protein
MTRKAAGWIMARGFSPLHPAITNRKWWVAYGKANALPYCVVFLRPVVDGGETLPG